MFCREVSSKVFDVGADSGCDYMFTGVVDGWSVGSGMNLPEGSRK